MATLTAGDQAPNFELSDQTGKTHKLSDYQGSKVVVYFYPKANTPGCTTQACAVRDAKDDWAARGVHALGISPDGPKAQKSFDEKYDLGFPLLCDEDNAVAEAFGVWGEKNMYGKTYMGIIRSAFLIDEEGKIQQAWYKISPKKTVSSIQAELS